MASTVSPFLNLAITECRLATQADHPNSLPETKSQKIRRVQTSGIEEASLSSSSQNQS